MGAIVALESFSHTDDVIYSVTNGFVKCDHWCIGFPDLQVDLGATQLPKFGFQKFHHLPSITPPLMRRRYCQIIDPAAMTFIAAHDRSYNFIFDDANQKQFR